VGARRASGRPLGGSQEKPDPKGFGQTSGGPGCPEDSRSGAAWPLLVDERTVVIRASRHFIHGVHFGDPPTGLPPILPHSRDGCSGARSRRGWWFKAKVDEGVKLGHDGPEQGRGAEGLAKPAPIEAGTRRPTAAGYPIGSGVVGRRRFRIETPGPPRSPVNVLGLARSFPLRTSGRPPSLPPPRGHGPRMAKDGEPRSRSRG